MESDVGPEKAFSHIDNGNIQISREECAVDKTYINGAGKFFHAMTAFPNGNPVNGRKLALCDPSYARLQCGRNPQLLLFQGQHDQFQSLCIRHEASTILIFSSLIQGDHKETPIIGIALIELVQYRLPVEVEKLRRLLTKTKHSLLYGPSKGCISHMLCNFTKRRMLKMVGHFISRHEAWRISKPLGFDDSTIGKHNVLSFLADIILLTFPGEFDFSHL